WGKDEKIDSIVSDVKNMVGKSLDSVIGIAEADIKRRLDNRIDSPLGNLITDIMRDWAKTDIAIQNSGGIRSDIQKGNITKRTLYNVQPFDNTAVIMEFKGEKLENILEKSFENPYGGIQISGINVIYIQENERKKIKRIIIEGKEIDRAGIYTVCTNSYLAYGGEGYEFNRIGRVVKDTGVNIRDIIEEYIKRKGRISVIDESRYIEIGGVK
ncbi:MAG: 5'-nucleotidase C-terminal domain-containing protein, partial [bacterium]